MKNSVKIVLCLILMMVCVAVVSAGDPPTITSISHVYGSTSGNTVVTITGTGFVTGATLVTFGGVQANSYTVNSATQITTTAPAHAVGQVSVTVSTPNGYASKAKAFIYEDVPARSSVRSTHSLPLSSPHPVVPQGRIMPSTMQDSRMSPASH